MLKELKKITIYLGGVLQKKARADAVKMLFDTKLKNLKEEEEFDLCDSPDEILGVKIPIAMTPPSNKGRVKFRPPSSTKLVRSDQIIKYGDKLRIQVKLFNVSKSE